MARIHLSPLFTGIHGKLANAIYEQTRGVHYVKPLKSPTGPPTPAQLAHRAAYRTALDDWQDLGPYVADPWAAFAQDTNTTPMNRWLAYNIMLARATEAVKITPPNPTYAPAALDRFYAAGPGGVQPFWFDQDSTLDDYLLFLWRPIAGGAWSWRIYKYIYVGTTSFAMGPSHVTYSLSMHAYHKTTFVAAESFQELFTTT